MTDGPRESKDSARRSPEEAALSARLKRLGKSLGEYDTPKPEVEADQAQAQRASQLARGFRLSTELVAGVLVGAFLGWALDRWLGTSPWGMFVFLLVGFAAGIVNVLRAAGLSEPPRSGR